MSSGNGAAFPMSGAALLRRKSPVAAPTNGSAPLNSSEWVSLSGRGGAKSGESGVVLLFARSCGPARHRNFRRGGGQEISVVIRLRKARSRRFRPALRFQKRGFAGFGVGDEVVDEDVVARHVSFAARDARDAIFAFVLGALPPLGVESLAVIDQSVVVNPRPRCIGDLNAGVVVLAQVEGDDGGVGNLEKNTGDAVAARHVVMHPRVVDVDVHPDAERVVAFDQIVARLEIFRVDDFDARRAPTALETLDVIERKGVALDQKAGRIARRSAVGAVGDHRVAARHAIGGNRAFDASGPGIS